MAEQANWTPWGLTASVGFLLAVGSALWLAALGAPPNASDGPEAMAAYIHFERLSFPVTTPGPVGFILIIAGGIGAVAAFVVNYDW